MEQVKREPHLPKDLAESRAEAFIKHAIEQGGFTREQAVWINNYIRPHLT